jgi:hypothetical protein
MTSCWFYVATDLLHYEICMFNRNHKANHTYTAVEQNILTRIYWIRMYTWPTMHQRARSSQQAAVIWRRHVMCMLRRSTYSFVCIFYEIKFFLSCASVGVFNSRPTFENIIVKWELSNCEVSGSHGAEYEDGCLLGCCTVLFSRSLPTFQRCLLPTSSGRSYHKRLA